MEAPAPVLLEPADGSTTGSMGPLLRWSDPSGAAGYQLQVLPYNGDGPGIDIIRSGPGASFQIPPPPLWYGLLPDMTYTWRLRSAVGHPGSELWGPWSERTFRTPVRGSQSITLDAPTASVLSQRSGPIVILERSEESRRGAAPESVSQSTIRDTGATPALHWNDAQADVFYYEVELSSDAAFNTDPATATAAVYQSLIHGGVTGNTYRVPPDSPLQDGITYHWRVRPRVQGDGRPVAWSRTASFVTPEAAGGPPSATATLEAATLGLINQVRTEHGLTTLSLVAELSLSARLHSADMASRNFMSHTGSDGSGPGERISRAGYDWLVYGEIVAAGYATPAAVVDGWMASPPHREVILMPGLREFGAGLAYSAAGRPYWTVNLGAR